MVVNRAFAVTAGTIDLERQTCALYNLTLFAIGGECSSKAEHLAVAQVVVGSIPITHPIFYLFRYLTDIGDTYIM